MNQKNSVTDFKYLVASEQDKKFGLFINRVGTQLIQARAHHPILHHSSINDFKTLKNQGSPEYQLIYITKGKGTLTFDGCNEIALSEGSLFVIYPGQYHAYQPLVETGWGKYSIQFQGSIMDNIVVNSFLPPTNQVFDVGLIEELVAQFKRAIEIAKIDDKSTQQYLSGIVMYILGFVISMTRNKLFETTDVATKIEQAKIIMTENVCAAIDIQDIASDLDMGYACFRKVFKEHTGYPPINYFNEMKMKKARQLLIETSYPVKKIALMLGYNATEYFFTLFKKKTGYTPSEYRQFARGKAS